MTINQKMAWIDIVVAAIWLAGLIIIFSLGGTLLFWETDWMRLAFLAVNSVMALSVAGIRALVTNRTYSKAGPSQVLMDEREAKIKGKAESRARLSSLVAVIASVLALFFYGEGSGGDIPAYFLFYPLIIYAFTYLFSSGIGTLLMAKQDVSNEPD